MAEKFEITGIDRTKAETAAYLKNVVEPQILELQTQLELLQQTHRVISRVFDLQAKPMEGETNLSKAMRNVDRAQFSGEPPDDEGAAGAEGAARKPE